MLILGNVIVGREQTAYPGIALRKSNRFPENYEAAFTEYPPHFVAHEFYVEVVNQRHAENDIDRLIRQTCLVS
jgi:hypothetical protein